VKVIGFWLMCIMAIAAVWADKKLQEEQAKQQIKKCYSHPDEDFV